MGREAKIPIMVTTNKARESKPATSRENNMASSLLLFFLKSLKMGMNAWEKAPSAKILRNRLGMRKATQKASVILLAPKYWVITISRKNPMTLDRKVKPLMDKKDLIRFINGKRQNC